MSFWVVFIGMLLAGVALAQNEQGPPAGPPPYLPANVQPPERPDQRVAPQYPSFERRVEVPGVAGQDPGPGALPVAGPSAMPPQGSQPPQPPPAPFVLSPMQEAQLDQVLHAWEQQSQSIQTFACKFTRFLYEPYDPIADKNRKPGDPKFVDPGEIRYAAPDKGVLKIDTKERPEHWICDGKSIYQYNFLKKEVSRIRLPPEVQGKAIADGPLPFLFGASAEQLKRRYWMRQTTPEGTKGEVWLEAFPRYQRDAANYTRVELILRLPDMVPAAIQIHQPNKSRTSYTFEAQAVNKPRSFGDIVKDPFAAHVPFNWKMVDEDVPQGPPPAQPGRFPSLGSRPVNPR
jgi:TIGR03009 family protein